MKVFRYEDYTGNQGLIFDKIRFNNPIIKRLCDNSNEEFDKYILDTLHKIGSKIYYINTKDRYCSCCESKVLALEYLSSSEKLFILCCLAECNNKNILVSEYLKSLDNDNFKLFFDMFKHSKNIDIVIPRNSGLLSEKIYFYTKEC